MLVIRYKWLISNYVSLWFLHSQDVASFTLSGCFSRFSLFFHFSRSLNTQNSCHLHHPQIFPTGLRQHHLLEHHLCLEVLFFQPKLFKLLKGNCSILQHCECLWEGCIWSQASAFWNRCYTWSIYFHVLKKCCLPFTQRNTKCLQSYDLWQKLSYDVICSLQFETCYP